MVQVATYWAMEKFDLFHFQSGAMVATRDHHNFEGEGAKLAAGAPLQKSQAFPGL
jgi:hypothetical protein